MINSSLKQKLREFGVEESKIEAFAEKAMQDFNKTEEELEALVETWLKSSSTNEKTKEEKEAAGEQSAAFAITAIFTAIGYFIAWFYYKDKDGWLIPYLSSFLNIFYFFLPAYQVALWIVHGLNSVMKTTMSYFPRDRYY